MVPVINSLSIEAKAYVLKYPLPNFLTVLVMPNRIETEHVLFVPLGTACWYHRNDSLSKLNKGGKVQEGDATMHHKATKARTKNLFHNPFMDTCRIVPWQLNF